MARRQRRKRMKQRAVAPAAEAPPPEEQRLDLPPEVVYQLMRRYTLPAEQLHMLGFPHSSSFHRGKAYIYKGLAGSPRPARKVKLDAAAKEFVPRALASSDCDSGTHSSETGDDSSAASSGSEPDEQQVPDDVSEPESVHSSGSESERGEQRVSLLRPHCVRCTQQFAVTVDGYYSDQAERCVFHWGKLKSARAGPPSYACCGGRPGGRGCSTAPCHVWSGLLPGLNGPLKGYVRSRRRRVPPADSNYGVYALDCEMCYTGQGLELARVSVVGLNGKRVYDALVKPDRPVVDYNTRFSGITARQLDRATKTLRAVQSDLMGFISADTVLIGHGLENDLRALRLAHDTVVDTSVLFPHYLGLPYRRRLSHLTSSCLSWKIQEGGAGRGHDSLEDARACMQLVLWRARRDLQLE
ncbi:putative exonuclease GOR [Pollicipes pollicipes]|uniref:putative exonuclease GOR n=1 Tax=Pollicipes pollicipes TaxID=41117 RepID=UPI0018858479|nr:putative exonuclease GOR [Pollicipes pollicipes]